MKQFLNAAQLAKLLKVDRATVIRWIQRDRIHGAVQLASGREWRIPIDAYVKLIHHQQHEGRHV